MVTKLEEAAEYSNMFQEYVILNGNKTGEGAIAVMTLFQEYVILNGNKTSVLIIWVTTRFRSMLF